MAVDTVARKKVSSTMEAYLRCCATSDELDDALLLGAKTDTACFELHRALFDTLYCMSCCHKNEGEFTLTEKQQGMFRRWIALLDSADDWPLYSQFSWNRALRLLGGLYCTMREFVMQTSSFKNEYWPYQNAEDWRRYGRIA